MLLVVALLVLALFGGLGFVAHILWLGLLLGLILAVVHAMGRGPSRTSRL